MRHPRLPSFIASSVLATLLPTWWSAAVAADLQIMTVGDSITANFIYQPRLKALLEADSNTVTFVGSQGSAPNRHEGFSGKGIYDFVGAIPLPGGSTHYITTALNNAWPSAPSGSIPVVLVHIGINDMGHGLGRQHLTNAPQDGSGNCLAAQLFSADGGGSFLNPLGTLDGLAYGAWLKLRLDTLVDLVLAHPSQPRLVIAKILPIAKGNSLFNAENDNCCERIKEWNGYWAAKVASISGPAAARITLVDCYTDAEPKRVYGAVPGTSLWGDATAQAGDWVHPNSAVGGGYTLMATKFKGGIDTLLGAAVTPTATWSGTTFAEAVANDGSIGNQLTITLANDTFTGSDGDNLITDGKVTVSNVPAGLTASVTRTSATVVTVALSGNATAHANANDVANLIYVFANSAVASGTAAAVNGLNVSNRVVNFADPTLSGVTVAEPFAYAAAAGGLANQNGGTGWTAAWDGGANSINSTGLTYSSGADTLSTSGGSADILSTPTTISSFRALPGSITNGSLWLSYLAQVQTPGSGYAGLSLFAGGNEKLFIGQRNGQSVWGLEGNGQSGNSTGSSASTTLLVARIDLKPGNDDAFLWTNPALNAIPADSAATQLLAFSDFTVDRLRLECGFGSGTFHVDEVRCGTSFASVAPRVAVVNQAPTVPRPASATPATVTGTTTAVAVLGADDGGEAALTYTWSATGPAAVGFSPNGTHASRNATATFGKAGSYVLTVTISDGLLNVTNTVNMTVSAVLSSLSASPASTTVVANGTATFSASGADQFGTALTIQPSITWTVPSAAGSISNAGVLTAAATAGGPFTVTATTGSFSATTQVTVSAIPPATSPPVATSPGSASTVTVQGDGGSSGGCGLGSVAMIGLTLALLARARQLGG